MKNKYTTSDIAKQLNLSRATVSKALNNHPSIPERTRKLVLETAESLGYRHIRRKSIPIDADNNFQGSEPEVGSTKTVAFLIKSSINIFQEEFWSEVLRGVEESARQNNYQLVLTFGTDEDLHEGRLPDTIASHSADGIILAGITSKRYTEVVTASGIPVVLIDGYYDSDTSRVLFDSVLSENEQAARNLTCHLIELGHKEIGFIGDISISRSFMERYLGYRHAMVDADLLINKNYCILEPSQTNYYSIQEFSRQLDAMNPLPTAFVCANDLVALQIIRYLESVGLRVPTDLSVTGFDMMGKRTDSTLPLSRLTTAEVKADRIGARSFEQLLWRMEHADRPYEFVRLISPILIGESTTAPTPTSKTIRPVEKN
ncbi:MULTISPECIES: LacI family DNA-binding transcriptional regulator [Paenibacillus]|uniref:LacI family DNA-binding transcriptional regulator n=1 Tax=Paenibacillus TaxID=44249 RepID=UPI00096F5E66|nr:MULTISPECIES: LacI family DNA-binding transcriptional regulator [Paenibacillus]OMF70297.1 hypothetical protein BK143_17420 [Paenibacillus peoriae]OMF81223.1 hypothetical protein BK145_07290 [Paenibacillus peoriae]POR28573.1 LacI family transcriptional regulator [Paenibacillus polymyxa]